MSSVFDLELIKHNQNADKLFRQLLIALDQQYGPNIPLWIAVREISNKIPIGTANIDNDSSYNYAMIALFGGQKGRDFFNFQKAGIREEFTAQANDTGRNNRFWTRFIDEKVQINPKYYS